MRARWIVIAILMLLLLPTAAVAADDEEPNVDFFYPLVTRRPVIERELELRVEHDKRSDGRVTGVFGAIEMPILSRWLVELEVPLIFRDPRDGAGATGFGDVTIENKVQIYKSVQHRALVALGFEVKLPSGSQRRDLGGEASIEPFVTAGIGRGPFELLADIAWERNLNAHVDGPHEQELSAGVAGGWILHRWFEPLLELRFVNTLRGGESAEGEHESLRGRTQVYLVPGFNAQLMPGSSFRIGIELPVTSARQADYVIHSGFVWEF